MKRTGCFSRNNDLTCQRTLLEHRSSQRANDSAFALVSAETSSNCGCQGRAEMNVVASMRKQSKPRKEGTDIRSEDDPEKGTTVVRHTHGERET